MASDMDTHILNFYEDMSLPISDVPALIEMALTGRLEAREKLDGQNFTFTVIDSSQGPQLRFMGKGCPKWARAQGGLTREQLVKHYESKPQVRQAFGEAFDVLQHVISSVPGQTVSGLFRNGQNVVQAEVVTPINQNVVRYKKNAVCLIGVQAMGTRLGPMMAPESFLRFQDAAQDIGSVDGWGIMKVPVVEFKPSPGDGVRIDLLKNEFQDLRRNLSSSTTMGDLLTMYVAKGLHEHDRGRGILLSGSNLHRAARRLAYDDASVMGKADFPAGTWAPFKEIDDERAMYVGEWIAPIEGFFRKLGSAVIDSYEFVLGDVDDPERVTEMREFVGRVKSALRDGRVRAPTPQILRRIQSAARRVDESLFTRNVEGIVFPWGTGLRKLTGAFTPVNRLRGYFSFENAAVIV